MTKRDKQPAARRVRLYALYHGGADGPFHSQDYPKVWEVLTAAKAYLREIPLPKRLNYRIVELRPVERSGPRRPGKGER